jgi:osmotically-inducible protein OsmY
MNLWPKTKTRLACIYAIPLACGLGAFASQVDGQDAPTDTRMHTSGTGLAASAVMNRKLSEQVRVALHADPYLYDRHVEVTADGDVVVLTGVVYSDWELQDALRIARKAAGNRRIVDNLSLERDFRR